ncbi:uncharacterized protein At2g29880-like [Macadamia integrifolia]|uniref:uncharacterized protein At2g29880-like n=1 Tax=Macadamia integrifolia TaxID=60698 RepID=UPI001C4F91E4|nr:uncharacterized protein At2g29880-like [Macadamia integrifolia]
MASSSTTILWNAPELEKFISLMIDNVRNDQRTKSTFTKVGWNNIKSGLETFQRPFRKEQLHNKMNKLRGNYNSFKQLLETTGFGWDSNTRTATAEDSVWDLAVKENPVWAKYRKSGLPWWPELQEIFSNSCSRGGRGVNPLTTVIPRSIHIDPDNEAAIPKQVSPPNVGLDDIEHIDVDEVTPTAQKRRLDRTPTDRREKSSLKQMNTSMCDFRAYAAWKMEPMCSTTSTPGAVSYASVTKPFIDPLLDGPYNMKNCQNLLDTITDVTPEITPKIYVNAQQKIHSDTAWRLSFVEMIPERRMWILQALK